MLDDSLRGLERAASIGTPMERRAARHRLKTAGGSAGLDLSIPYCFDWVDGKTYGDALFELREQATEIHPFYKGRARPLTFAETWQVLAHEHQKNGPASRMFNRYWTTSTGALYQAGKKKFKIVQLSEQLLDVEPGQEQLPANYESIVEPALRIKNGYYDQRLDRELARYHPAWKAALRNDELLSKAILVAFDGYTHMMPFWADKTFPQDTLVPLESLARHEHFGAYAADDLSKPYFLHIMPIYNPVDDDCDSDEDSDSDCDRLPIDSGDD